MLGLFVGSSRGFFWMASTLGIVLIGTTIAHLDSQPQTQPAQVIEIEDGEVLDQDHDYVELPTTANRFPSPSARPLERENDLELTKTPCCGSAAHLDNLHYLIVATMDGTIRALDVERNAEIAWEGNFDAQPLMAGTLGRVQPMSAEGRDFHLVPALDGSLYMYSVHERILEPIQLNTDSLLQASLKLGSEAVVGGKTVSTTGVDPVTGKVRYHCNMGNCEKVSTEDAHATLVFRRSGHAIRALDGFTGTERWNLSVAEYEASLLIRNHDHMEHNVKTPFSFRVSPPEGIITAYDSCGGERWTITVENHVAHMWEMKNGELREISLFEAKNIHTLSAEDELDQRRQQPLRESQSLLYLGTSNNQPFIIHSPHLKAESTMRLATRSTRDGQVGSRGQLLPAVRNTYIVEPTTLVEMLTTSYDNSVSKKVEINDDHNKQVALRGRRDVVVTDRKDDWQTRTSCPNGDGIALIGQSDIRSAKFPIPLHDEGTSDDGYFIMRHSSPRRGWFPRDRYEQQCSGGFVPRLRRQLRLDETVSGWWRAVALFVITLLGVLVFPVVKIVRRLKARARANAERALLPCETEDSMRKENNEKVESPAAIVAVPSISSSTDLSSAPALVRQRTNQSGSDTQFESKFLQDYEVLRVLGKGGYGVVFSARNKMDDIVYAIKRIAVSDDPKAIERVQREVKTMARFDHPGIIRYYHSWKENPPPEWQEENDRQLLKALKRQRVKGKDRADDFTENTNSISIPMAVGMSCKSDGLPEFPDDPQPSFTSNSGNSLELLLNKKQNRPELVEDPPADPDQNEDSSESWLDSGEEAKTDRGSTSDSSDDEASSDDEEEPMIAFDRQEGLKDDSDSVVFEASQQQRLAVQRTRQQSTKSTSSQETSKIIEPPAIIVTSQNNDLLPTRVRKTRYHAYIYIQMQLCQSRTLSDWLKANSEDALRDLSRMRSWFEQLVKATEYIHNQGLIHRDIKPQNIFFAADDVLKIGDMGLVSKNLELTDDCDSTSSASENPLHTGDVGTKSYMSPEQLAHRPYTNKVDVFSLGMVFVEMVLPFSTTMERLTTLGQLQKGRVPKELDGFPKEKKFASWLCAKDPSKRPTCAEILSDPYLMMN